MKKDFMDYNVGDVIGGVEIEAIISASPDIIVYWSNGNGIGYNFNSDHIPCHPDIFARFNEICAKIPSEISDSLSFSINSQLGGALFNALDSKSDDPALEYFELIEKRVEALKTPQQMKTSLLSWSFLYLVAFLVCALAVDNLDFLGEPNLEEIVYVALSGTIGSFLSLSIRNDQIKLPDEPGKIFIHLQVINKLATGLMSGVVVYFAIKSNLVLGLVDDNIFAIYFFGFIGGFSERFIPELVDKVQKDAGSAKKPKDSSD